jgi:16S rRNA processing protein RimM
LNITRSLFFSRVFLRKKGNLEEREVESFRPLRGVCIIRLKGIHTLEQARDLAGREICLPKEHLQSLEGGQYYFHQLIGCSVVMESGSLIGLVKDVLFIKDNDLLVIEKKKGEICIPFTESICIEIDLENKKIIVDPPKGLLELNEI